MPKFDLPVYLTCFCFYFLVKLLGEQSPVIHVDGPSTSQTRSDDGEPDLPVPPQLDINDNEQKTAISGSTLMNCFGCHCSVIKKKKNASLIVNWVAIKSPLYPYISHLPQNKGYVTQWYHTTSRALAK